MEYVFLEFLRIICSDIFCYTEDVFYFVIEFS